MAAFASNSMSFVALAFLVLFMGMGGSRAQLNTSFYDKSCPRLASTVKGAVQIAVQNESRVGASLLRLHFHDCFVNGCDASVLLDDTKSWQGEKTAVPNNNSARGFEVIDTIKSEVENVCPGVVSCADILAIVARDSVHALGGPSWDVKLGRRDSLNASFTAANSGSIPPPTSSLAQLEARFRALNLTQQDLVALSGGHTIGQARCTSFKARIYNETMKNRTLASELQSNCLKRSALLDNQTAPLDFQTPTFFDNSYYSNVLHKNGLLHSDNQLLNSKSTGKLVKTYSSNLTRFESDFVAAMIKMGDINPLIGPNGEIRKNCRKVN